MLTSTRLSRQRLSRLPYGLVLIAMTLTPVFVGCDGSGDSHDDEHGHGHSHDHDHEHGHSHDEPRSFAESLELLDEHFALLKKSVTRGNSIDEHAVDHILHDMNDLPVRAADSDLDEQRWNQVDAFSKEVLETMNASDFESKVDRAWVEAQQEKLAEFMVIAAEFEEPEPQDLEDAPNQEDDSEAEAADGESSEPTGEGASE